MSVVVSLERDVQRLIDLRLDLLDRVLMDSGIARSERSEIVQSVEDQIFEMLDERGGEATRDAMLQLLRELDPPEAYWSEGASAESSERSFRAARRMDTGHPSSATLPTRVVTGSKNSGAAIASFVLAMISIPTFIIFPVGSLVSIAGLVCGLIGLASIGSSGGQLRGRWMAIVGCSTFAVHLSFGLLLIFWNM